MRDLATDIGRVDAWTVLERQLRILQIDDFDLSWSLVRDAAVTWHLAPPPLAVDRPSAIPSSFWMGRRAPHRQAA
jgi:hypothetical protein